MTAKSRIRKLKHRKKNHERSDARVLDTSYGDEGAERAQAPEILREARPEGTYDT